MSDFAEKARAAVDSYRGLLVERPSPHRVKRFLIAVNGWCNSRCTFCNIWQYDKARALKEEITLEELEQNLFSSAALDEVIDIGVTGGEPFLRNDLADLCHSMFARFLAARIGIVTNGLLSARIAENAAAIARADPHRELSVAVSLDGYGETHDRVRGVPGNFDRVLRTVDLLKAEAPGVAIGLSHTVTPTNMQDSLRCY